MCVQDRRAACGAAAAAAGGGTGGGAAAGIATPPARSCVPHPRRGGRPPVEGGKGGGWREGRGQRGGPQRLSGCASLCVRLPHLVLAGAQSEGLQVEGAENTRRAAQAERQVLRETAGAANSSLGARPRARPARIDPPNSCSIYLSEQKVLRRTRKPLKHVLALDAVKRSLR